MEKRRNDLKKVCLCDSISFKVLKTIDDLDLQDYVKKSARSLKDKHPNVEFTSGRRSVSEQAVAMAKNITQNRNWIKETYAASAERDALQKWVDEHPDATTVDAIADGLKSIMSNWSDAQKTNLSRHFSGEAFDVNPVEGSDGDKIKETIRNLPRLRKFLESEGGLTIWHAEFQ